MPTENRKKTSSSATFKTGAVSLAFLIIGYQASIFIHKAAVLRIEANRDRPDTVYVYVRADSSGSQERRDTFRAEAPHSGMVKEVRRKTARVESFRFDPNTASAEEFQRLGFSEKQAQALCNYRAKGGRFWRKEDFSRSFVVADSVYSRLEPYICIPRLDINKADSAAFDALPGIGPYFAGEMVEYRRKIGRYSTPEQLMDIRNFDRERYDALKDLIYCGDDVQE